MRWADAIEHTVFTATSLTKILDSTGWYECIACSRRFASPQSQSVLMTTAVEKRNQSRREYNTNDVDEATKLTAVVCPQLGLDQRPPYVRKCSPLYHAMRGDSSRFSWSRHAAFRKRSSKHSRPCSQGCPRTPTMDLKAEIPRTVLRLCVCSALRC